MTDPIDFWDLPDFRYDMKWQEMRDELLKQYAQEGKQYVVRDTRYTAFKPERNPNYYEIWTVNRDWDYEDRNVTFDVLRFGAEDISALSPGLFANAVGLTHPFGVDDLSRRGSLRGEQRFPQEITKNIINFGQRRKSRKIKRLPRSLKRRV